MRCRREQTVLSAGRARGAFLAAVALVATGAAVVPAVVGGSSASAVGPVTERISVSSSQSQDPIGESRDPSLSADGRFVAFWSSGILSPLDADYFPDVYVRDRQTDATELISIGLDGVSGHSPSVLPAISADGNVVAFTSTASGLVAVDTTGDDVFVRDRAAGTTQLVSVSSTGVQGAEGSGQPAISANGRVVGFVTAAGLDPGDSNGATDVYVRDLNSGTTEHISVATGGTPADAGAVHPSLSADGRFVTFESAATNLAPGVSGTQIYVRDRVLGTTTLVSVDAGGGPGNNPSNGADISDDGRFVVFSSEATNLAGADFNASADIFMRDVSAGTTARVSVATDGSEADGASLYPSISGDATAVSFLSWATNLAGGGPPPPIPTTTGPPAPPGTEPPGTGPPTTGPTPTTEFVPPTTNFFPPPTTGPGGGGSSGATPALYLRRITTGETSQVDVSTGGEPANAAAVASPSLNLDGTKIGFGSTATNLDSFDANGTTADVFVRDLDPPTGPPTTISGVVTNTGGTPLAGIMVSANGSVSYGGYATTGPDGAYTISGLTTDTYRINFADSAAIYSPEWWDDQINFATATPLSIIEGTAIGNVDVVMSLSAISGIVTNAVGDPLPGIQVTAWGTLASGYAYTGADGRYTIGGLVPGSYAIVFYDPTFAYSMEWLGGVPSEAASTPVSVVDNQTTTGIDTALSVTTLSGVVTNGSGQPLANVAVTMSGQYSTLGATTGPDGSYTVSGLMADSYRMGFYDNATGQFEFWDNQADYLSATMIPVAYDDVLTGYDAVIGAADPDVTPPVITVQRPLDGARYTIGQAITADYFCTDAGGSVLATCVGTVAPFTPIDTSTAGSHSFTVDATDGAGNSASTSVTYVVLAGDATQVVSGGETVTTDPGGLGATPAAPVQTTIDIPVDVAGTVSVTPAPLGTSPAGFTLLGQELQLTGPVASSAAPYVVTFTVDASALGGTDPADVQVFRNGAVLGICTDPTAAIPDPCIAARGPVAGGGGDGFVTVRTTQFSTWNVGKLAYTLTGFFGSVDNLPEVNEVKAGSTITVKFSLGGNRGLDVFADGFPATYAVPCPRGSHGGSHGLSHGGSAGATPTVGRFSLSYDARHGRYTLKWKTDKTSTGCRDLVLTFRDGSSITARFSFEPDKSGKDD